MMQAIIQVGIMFAPQVKFKLWGEYRNTENGEIITGEGVAELFSESEITLSLNGKKQNVALPFFLEPLKKEDCFFELKDVTIGINFHWERKEDQRFTGGLKIIREKNHLTAINVLPLEDYLRSVISSEMSATSSEELLKAHAVISRSWLLAQIEKEEKLRQTGPQKSGYFSETEHIRWYDREDHVNFHVCADDHCQRYQGITRASTAAVDKAIEETFGQVLSYNGEICDARYSKCCGGVTETFENVWEPVDHPYLVRLTDLDHEPGGYDTQLDTEEKAEKWIRGNPEAFCNTTDKQILSQVLNDYDQETFDFFRWKKEYSQAEIRRLLRDRIGIEVGDILALEPVERGVSSRLIKLRIKGTAGTIIIGKELEIRKAFSDSHLYSSAFVVDALDVQNGIPQKFVLTGAGWGHGVGLCQIGAAVMGAKGYSYQDILSHYFRGAVLEKKY
ncbi:MAG: SpoIID/LytB domain-containing protein [Bacteroidota bacterium]